MSNPYEAPKTEQANAEMPTRPVGTVTRELRKLAIWVFSSIVAIAIMIFGSALSYMPANLDTLTGAATVTAMVSSAAFVGIVVFWAISWGVRVLLGQSE